MGSGTYFKGFGSAPPSVSENIRRQIAGGEPARTSIQARTDGTAGFVTDRYSRVTNRIVAMASASGGAASARTMPASCSTPTQVV